MIQRLTSGYRIGRAGDDTAGLAIANRFRTDSSELIQGVRNLNDGISRLQIIDGGVGNISKILDRLKVLASQSATDTFSGDRNTLNSEFQTLLAEIDRQAESIGLNSNGEFAQLLSVFVGGSGGASGVTVNVDLRASAVDARGLGLGGAKGMQAVAGGADIGPTSLDHTVAQIVLDPGNTTATPGYTDFCFSGPGFSDGNRVEVSVNLQGVTSLAGLAAAINSAIQIAASGATPAAAAFAQAGIVASAYNGRQLAFTSANTPFQVEAGDVMANALMGHLNGAAGAALATTVAGVATAAGGAVFVPTNVTVRITGGSLPAPVDITLNPASITTALAITDLAALVNTPAQLNAAGISVSGAPGGPLTFTNARGEKFSVQATGDAADALGLGSFLAGAGGAVDYTSISGTAYDNTLSTGIAHLEFSFNGGPSIAIPGIDLAGGDAVFPGSRSGANLQQTLNDAFAANPALQAAGLVATFTGANLTIASSNNTFFRINPGTSGAFADLGFGTSGAAFTTPLTVAQAASTTIEPTGTTAVSSLSFTALSYGSESQTITVSATDIAGILQTVIVTLRNNDQGRNGRGIDEAIADINAKLLLGGSTLQQIVAVKENVGGEERIAFLSSLRSFHVTVGDSANGNGLNAGVAASEASFAVLSQVSTSVADKDAALLALTAVTGAVSALGAVQAVVGKAENQLSYAIDLSQSQVTNLLSADSRIRDTDVAAEAANLTKSQILVQASVAAMAQANSAAQTVLALLKG
ncbi:MAG: flagellin [Candidatus Solibacter sp.]|nr:flagellin [Candidatus Solibacter sp.]